MNTQLQIPERCMRSHTLRLLSICSIVLLSLTAKPSTAAPPPIRQRAIDALILKDSTKLLGVIVPEQVSVEGAQANPTYIRFVVREKWFSENASQIQSIATKPKLNNESDHLISLVQNEVDRLKQEPTPDQRRITFLEERLLQLETHRANNAERQDDIILLQINNKLIKYKALQSARNRQLASLGVVNNVNQVEELRPQDLAEELQLISDSDLLRQLPDQSTKAAQHEFARLQLAADNLFGKTCQLIQMGDRFIDEADHQQQAAKLIPELLAGQLQSQISQLLAEIDQPRGADNSNSTPSPPPPLLPPAAKEIATKAECQIVQTSQLEMNLSGGTAAVTVCLYHQTPGSPNWQLVTWFRQNADTSDIREEEKEQLQANPQVKEILTLFESLGAGSDKLDTAVFMGAVVQAAQRKAQSNIQDFLLSAGRINPSKPHLQILTLDSLPEGNIP